MSDAAEDWRRLYVDHPEVVESELSVSQIRDRYWQYFADRVRAARAEVHWRRVKAPFGVGATRIIEWLSQKVTTR